MAIKLAELGGSGFKLIQEGWHVFKITKVDYDERFGKIEIEMVTKDGGKHTERFNILTDRGQTNIGALKAFTYFASTVFNDFKTKEIDEQEMVGKFIEAEVLHRTSEVVSEKTGEPLIFTNLGGKKTSDGWEEGEEFDDLIGLLD